MGVRLQKTVTNIKMNKVNIFDYQSPNSDLFLFDAPNLFFKKSCFKDFYSNTAIYCNAKDCFVENLYYGPNAAGLMINLPVKVETAYLPSDVMPFVLKDLDKSKIHFYSKEQEEAIKKAYETYEHYICSYNYEHLSGCVNVDVKPTDLSDQEWEIVETILKPAAGYIKALMRGENPSKVTVFQMQ